MNPTEDDDEVLPVTRLDLRLEIRELIVPGVFDVTGPGEHGRRAFHIAPERAAEMMDLAEGVSLEQAFGAVLRHLARNSGG